MYLWWARTFPVSSQLDGADQSVGKEGRNQRYRILSPYIYKCMSSYSKKYKDSINRIILVRFISLYTHFSFGFGGVVWVSKKNINISTRLGTWYQAMTNINTSISASHTKQVEEYCICPVIILWLSASPINITLVQNKTMWLSTLYSAIGSSTNILNFHAWYKATKLSHKM